MTQDTDIQQFTEEDKVGNSVYLFGWMEMILDINHNPGASRFFDGPALWLERTEDQM